MFHPTCLTSLLALGLLAEHVIAAPAPTPRSAAAISWGSCESFRVNSTDPNLQCGTLDVPMDYHDSSAGTAHLAVIKYGATVPTKLGTIFFNPGGPGGSGLALIAALGPEFSQHTQGTYDVISWDPRGVGQTVPGEVYCFDSPDAEALFWHNTVFTYINETISGKFDQRDFDELYSQVDPSEQKSKDFGQRCQSGPSGQYLKYVGTSSTVRDLVSLGDAIVGVGEPIDYWGFSYGTVVGFNFVNMFPERVGHVILDGVVDPTTWISYKALSTALLDSEKTFSSLTDACAAAGKAGCKLIEFTGDGASGDDVKALLNNAHDLALELYRGGVQLPIEPGFVKTYLFNLLYFPATWSESVNTDVYQFVTYILQTAQANNVTIGGGVKYNVPSGQATIDETFLSGAAVPQNSTSYSVVAISGADNFNDDDVTIKDLFDAVVNITREITPTFGTIWSLGYISYGWPVRSVEELPPFDLTQLKKPVLVIGNSADPITPLAGAQHAAELLGDNSFLVHQLGFGHTTLAQASSCTLSIAMNYIMNSTLPQGGSTECAVDPNDPFPPLGGNTTTTKRSNFIRRWW